MKIGLFCGTFDPFTLAHYEIVKQCKKKLDHIIIMPSIVKCHRTLKSTMLNDLQRIVCIKNMISRLNNVHIDLSMLKIKEKYKYNDYRIISKLRFIHILKMIKYKINDDIFPIIGIDHYNNFMSWFKYNEILDLSSKLIVAVSESGYDRNFNKINLHYNEFIYDKSCFVELNKDVALISATFIRNQLKQSTIKDHCFFSI